MGYFRTPKLNPEKNLHAYVIGIALGDGNLSNSNKRAIRLRITCDKKYPKLQAYIKKSLESLLPENKVSLVDRKGRMDISVFSNHFAKILTWRWDKGSKNTQNASVPQWIKQNRNYTIECLRGLLQTDGCLYKDRGYPMVNFTNINKTLANDVLEMMNLLGYFPNMQRLKQQNGKTKHVVRLSKNVASFVKTIHFWKKNNIYED